MSAYDKVFGYTKDFRCSGSMFSGGVLWIYHRWHECAQAGRWLVTFIPKPGDRYENMPAVMDDFGSLYMLR